MNHPEIHRRLLLAMSIGSMLGMLLLLVALAPWRSWWGQAGAMGPETVAIVDGERIPKAAAVQRIRETFPNDESRALNIDQYIPQFGRMMVREELLYQEGLKRGIKVPEDEIAALQRVLGQAMERSKADADALPAEERNRRLRRSALIRHVQEVLTSSGLEVEEDAVVSYYQAHLDDLKIPGYRVVRRVVISTEAEAIRILNEMYLGLGFPEAARLYSITSDAVEGGLLPKISNAGLDVLEYGPILAELRPGTLSPVVRTSVGYQIFRVEEFVPDAVPTLDEARERITDRLKAKLGREQLDTWLYEQENSGRVVWNRFYFGDDLAYDPIPLGR